MWFLIIFFTILVIKPQFFTLKQKRVDELGESHVMVQVKGSQEIYFLQVL